MSTLDNSTRSADQRPVRLRARRDLVISQTLFQGEVNWVVKDPVAMKYFRFRKPEYRTLEMLDGTYSYSQILLDLEAKFPEQKFRLADVQQVTHAFHKNGLLVTGAPGQANPLRKRRNKELAQKAMGLTSSLVALRFPGVDPERFLNWLYPKSKWSFTSISTAASIALIVAAAVLILTNFDDFIRRMPEFHRFFGMNNLLFMGAILILTKSIHELGHGLMCKHFGGECHEIGFMLLVLTPAMYCDTSDSWILPNKWHRIAIGAAGMYIEIVIASLCTFVWWYTQPGVLHYLCLNIMFLSGVSTVLFNANPLLRYDGYYMLSDYLEIPNLSQKSKMAMLNKLRVWCLGMKPLSARMLPQRHQTVFALYSVASFFYRWFIVLMIFWFLTEIFEPYGLEVIGYIVVAISLFGMVVIPLFKLARFFSYPGRLREVKKIQTMITAVFLLVGLSLFFVLPLPRSVWVSFVIRPDRAQNVYVNQAGILKTINVRPGEQVMERQILAILENEDLELALLSLEGELAKERANLVAFQLSQNKFLDAALKVGETQAGILNLERQIELSKKKLNSLTLVADRKGEILLPPNIPAGHDHQDMELSGWSGTPLDAENLSAFLTRETLFCFVGDPARMKAVLVVDQSDVKFLKTGQPVELVLYQYRDQRIKGTIKNVSRDEMKILPRELSKTNGGPVASIPLPNGKERPLLKSYEATVSFGDMAEIQLLPGMHGNAKIRVGKATLASRTWRQIQTVLNFR